MSKRQDTLVEVTEQTGLMAERVSLGFARNHLRGGMVEKFELVWHITAPKPGAFYCGKRHWETADPKRLPREVKKVCHTCATQAARDADGPMDYVAARALAANTILAGRK